MLLHATASNLHQNEKKKKNSFPVIIKWFLDEISYRAIKLEKKKLLNRLIKIAWECQRCLIKKKKNSFRWSWSRVWWENKKKSDFHFFFIPTQSKLVYVPISLPFVCRWQKSVSVIKKKFIFRFLVKTKEETVGKKERKNFYKKKVSLFFLQSHVGDKFCNVSHRRMPWFIE